MTDILLAGLAMMLVLEGLMPLLAPRSWRETFRRAMELSDGQLRFVGLASILVGMMMLYVVT